MEELSIYTYTIVRSSTADFAGRVPYCTTILQRPDGTRFAALVDGYHEGDQIRVGQPVRCVTGEDGSARYQF